MRRSHTSSVAINIVFPSRDVIIDARMIIRANTSTGSLSDAGLRSSGFGSGFDAS